MITDYNKEADRLECNVPCKLATVAESMNLATQRIDEINILVRRISIFLFDFKPDEVNEADSHCFIDECKKQDAINKETVAILRELCDRLGC